LGINFPVGQMAIHIGMKTHYVRENIEDDILKLVLVRSEDSDADVVTNNMAQDLL
jgi:hypothetical protein